MRAYAFRLCTTAPTMMSPRTIALMDEFLRANGYENDITSERLHHEIYLSDPRNTAPAKLKTVVRHPIKKG